MVIAPNIYINGKYSRLILIYLNGFYPGTKQIFKTLFLNFIPHVYFPNGGMQPHLYI